MNIEFMKTTDGTVMTTDRIRREKPFIIVCLGMGRDSSGLLVLLKLLGIKPNLIIFSDLGAERSKTYQYLPVLNDWLEKVGFPPVTVVKARRARDDSFEHHIFRLGVFGSLSYGSHKCAVAWKIEMIQKYLKKCPAYREAVRQKRNIVKCVGYEAGEEYRADRQQKKCGKNCNEAGAFKLPEGETVYYPLIEHSYNLQKIIELIKREIGIVPCKSSCYFCAAMRPPERGELHDEEPEKFFKGLVLETIVQKNEVVKGTREGINYGKKWSAAPYAAQYAEAVERIYELFDLQRRVEDGLKNSDLWMPKAERVRLFIEFCADEKLFRTFLKTLDIPESLKRKLSKHKTVSADGRELGFGE